VVNVEAAVTATFRRVLFERAAFQPLAVVQRFTRCLGLWNAFNMHQTCIVTRSS